MNDFEVRMRIQGAVQEFVEGFMAQNQISAAVMEDALNKAMLYVKDLATKELVVSLAQQQQQQPVTQSINEPATSESEKKEENGDE